MNSSSERNIFAKLLEFGCIFSPWTVIYDFLCSRAQEQHLTKDSGAKTSDSTVTDLDTDELTQNDILQIVFSFDGVDYFNQWWTDETYSRSEKNK